MLGSALGKTFTSVPDYYSSYGVVLAVVAAGAILVAVAFTAARLIAPHRPLPAKLTTGSTPLARAGRRVRSGTTSSGSSS